MDSHEYEHTSCEVGKTESKKMQGVSLQYGVREARSSALSASSSRRIHAKGMPQADSIPVVSDRDIGYLYST